jgi:hypothetical protein
MEDHRFGESRRERPSAIVPNHTRGPEASLGEWAKQDACDRSRLHAARVSPKL